MQIIATYPDLKRLTAENILPDSFVHVLENAFRAMHATFRAEQDIRDFNLESYGVIAAITGPSGEVDLQPMGLTGTLTDTCPEFVEKAKLTDGTVYYRIGFLLNNDVLPVLYGLERHIRPAIREWLDGQAVEREGGECNADEVVPF
jgi:hypothetical protein